MTLIFETHATSLDNEAGLASGWFDTDLSAAGESQARATFFAFEHLLAGVPLADAISAPWQWRPGWTYTDEVKL